MNFSFVLRATTNPSAIVQRTNQALSTGFTRIPCTPVLAHALLINTTMIEQPRQSNSPNGQSNGHATVRLVRQVKQADDRIVTLISERPLVVLGFALAIGYVLGRVATRHG
jgi:hypothetical protein